MICIRTIQIFFLHEPLRKNDCIPSPGTFLASGWCQAVVGISHHLQVLVDLGLSFAWICGHLHADGLMDKLWLEPDAHHGIPLAPHIVVPQHGPAPVSWVAPEHARSELLALAQPMAFQAGHHCHQFLVDWFLGSNDALDFLDASLWHRHGKLALGSRKLCSKAWAAEMLHIQISCKNKLHGMGY